MASKYWDILFPCYPGLLPDWKIRYAFIIHSNCVCTVVCAHVTFFKETKKRQTSKYFYEIF